MLESVVGDYLFDRRSPQCDDGYYCVFLQEMLAAGYSSSRSTAPVSNPSVHPCGIFPFPESHRRLSPPAYTASIRNCPATESSSPLSALGLVAGDCVGVFDLQGLIVGICPESLHPHRGGSYIGKEFRIAVGGLKQRLLLCVAGSTRPPRAPPRACSISIRSNNATTPSPPPAP